ncbi:MAG TPA: ABC transporter permease [Methylomirabilota bacterium]|jgi:NitT/TauT family transport system permease protein|nr:ABC transporter permease [Methylomirabilota bacterium]
MSERLDALADADTEALPSAGARLAPYLYPALTLAGLVVAWEAFTKLTAVSRLLLPAPSDVAATLVSALPLLAHMSAITAAEFLLGFGLSVVVGIPLGALLVYARPVELAVYPLLVASQTVPKAAIAPIFVVWLGAGMTSKVLIAFTIAFFPIVIDTAIGLRAAPPEVVNVVRSMGANAFQVFWFVRFPNALPNIFGGLKVASTLAVVGAIVGEFVSAEKGLGYLVLVANGELNTTLVFASVVTLSVLGVGFYFLLELVERFVIRWHVSARRPGTGTM